MANMLSAQKNNQLQFLKMNAAGNDFIIFDARSSDIALSVAQIQKLCDRKNIGCDQLVIIKKSAQADCLMQIYNQDGSQSSACGNATRCVAALIMAEKKSIHIIIETAAGLLECKGSNHDLKKISVAMGVPIFEKNFVFIEKDFFCINMGNPHAVLFVEQIPQDRDFFSLAPQIENHNFFPDKTNVEFAKIVAPNLIEVRVWERGAGETLACGSGACAVAAAAIKNNLVRDKKIIIRFKGGDLEIEWNSDQSSVIMTGGYKKIFTGLIDHDFFN